MNSVLCGILMHEVKTSAYLGMFILFVFKGGLNGVGHELHCSTIFQIHSILYTPQCITTPFSWEQTTHMCSPHIFSRISQLS
jgi:uncharacterized membrane protein